MVAGSREQIVALACALVLAACSANPPEQRTSPFLESSENSKQVLTAGAEPPEEFASPWVNVCSLACLKTADNEPIEILLDADHYQPLHCWAFVITGDEPTKSCTAHARSLCNQQAHRINTQESAYFNCSVEYANCYTPIEMSACSVNAKKSSG